MKFLGVIIEESLVNKKILAEVEIVYTVIEKVTPLHQTPWLTMWTKHTVQIPESEINIFSEMLSLQFDRSHTNWYADFKNELFHFIVFPEKVFRIARINVEEYQVVVEYGKSLGIPEHQLGFSLAGAELQGDKL